MHPVDRAHRDNVVFMFMAQWINRRGRSGRLRCAEHWDGVRTDAEPTGGQSHPHRAGRAG